VETSITSALAALAGTTIGGLTSVVANWLNQKSQIRAQWLHHERSRRQILYRDFIEEASKCYIDALQHHEADADIPGLVGLYAKLGRMRVLSSRPVVHSAEHIAKRIMDTYLQPDKSFVELRDMAKSGAIDLLREFSDTCRDEFEQMRAQQF
jgi:ferredoxin-NADP reductase